MKAIGVIFGILVMAVGIYCFISPITAYSAIAIFVAVAMLIEGIGTISSWMRMRKLGVSTVLPLISGIISIVLGAILLVSAGMQVVFDLLVAYMVAFWLLVIGALRIVAGIQERNLVINAKGWIASVVLGVVLVICAILAFFEPTFSMVAIGYLLGFSILVAGITTIAVSVR